MIGRRPGRKARWTGEQTIRERDVINFLRERFPGSGIGDDAAVLPAVDGEILFAADAAVENVHFDPARSTYGQAVQKLVTANVSDIYAMGGKALTILFTAGLPHGAGDEMLEDIALGLRTGCDYYGIDLAGGDTVLSPEGCFFNIAILGGCGIGEAVMRTGARPGDALVISGDCGGSLAGMRLLEAIFSGKGEKPFRKLLGEGGGRPEAARGCIPHLSLRTGEEDLRELCEEHGLDPGFGPVLDLARRHLCPRAGEAAGASEGAGPGAHAMIDISDGVARDLRTLCRESGVGAVIFEEALPLPRILRERLEAGDDYLLDLALSSGEEYSILEAIADSEETRLPCGTVKIGSVLPAAEGITVVGRGGERREIPDGGYEHIF